MKIEIPSHIKKAKEDVKREFIRNMTKELQVFDEQQRERQRMKKRRSKREKEKANGKPTKIR